MLIKPAFTVFYFTNTVKNDSAAITPVSHDPSEIILIWWFVGKQLYIFWSYKILFNLMHSWLISSNKL